MQEPQKILIIDDDPSIGEMLKDVLEFSGYEVVYSKRPDEAEKNIEIHEVDLVLLDKLMSGVDGTDVCRRLRSNENVAQVPVIMMTALHDAKNICIEAGATDFISKPFEMQTLLDTISRVLQKAS
ncbi:MAG: response regulator [Gillisia sp.]